MRLFYVEPRAASWTFIIYGDTRSDQHLVEDAPFDPETRETCRLIQPIRDWLAVHEHKMTIDRGDMGEGTEHFHISFDTQDVADAFAEFVAGLK